MARSVVFASNRSQAVRLPKAVAFPEAVYQVEIIRFGNFDNDRAEPNIPHDHTRRPSRCQRGPAD